MVINPALSSASQQAQLSSSSAQLPQELNRINDRTTTTRTAAENSTVSLSESAQRLADQPNQSPLAASQQVNGIDSVESTTTEANQTASGLSYGSSVETKLATYRAIDNL